MSPRSDPKLRHHALARRRDARRTAAETPKVSVDTSTRPTPSSLAAAVSRTTMLAFSALGNTDALATSGRMSRPDIGLAMTPTVTSATSRWRLTRQPLACCSPFALPAAAVARAVSGIRVSAAADKGHDRHLTRPA